MVNKILAAMVAVLLMVLPGCGRRTLRLDFVPVEDKLKPEVVEQDQGMFIFDKIAVINLSGMLANTRASSVLSQGTNPVSDLRETLNAIERDPSVKAVVLRINSPGGTVTASDMMYQDIMHFKARSHKPVVCSMMDLCASGGYYVSCAADYRMAYPTTLTGSIGVIVQTINFSGTLDKLGISAKALTSGPNKDMGSPLRPLTKNDEKLILGFVHEFYGQFVKVVKDSRPNVKDEDWPMLTDGRVVTGRDAYRYGLVDQLGGLDDAIVEAKKMAKISRAKIVQYTRQDEHKGSVYAAGEVPAPQMNMININADLQSILPSTHPQFLYLWQGQ